MAAGIIYQTVTTTAGETVELAFYVDDTVTPTTWIPASLLINTAGASLAKAIDAVAGGTDHGLPPIGVRDDALSTLTPAEGDWVPFRFTSTGALWVQDASLNTNGQTTRANSSPVVLPLSTNVIDVTLSLDTAAYASGDLIAETQQVDAAMASTNGTGVLQSLMVIDGDDQGAAFDIYFLSANVSMGTENSAPSISDANAANILGIVSIGTGDYKDLGGVKVASVKGIGMALKSVSATDDIYVAVVNGTGTPTYTASGVVLRLGILQD